MTWEEMFIASLYLVAMGTAIIVCSVGIIYLLIAIWKRVREGAKRLRAADIFAVKDQGDLDG